MLIQQIIIYNMIYIIYIELMNFVFKEFLTRPISLDIL